MIPWDQWWFWLIAFLFGTGILAILGDTLTDILKALRGNPREIRELRRELQKLREELAEAQAARRLLELQRRLSQRERQRIERQALPEGVAVFLFTDIEDFTGYLERHGDERALQTVRRHHELIRRSAERYGGVVIQELGDGFLLSFSSARRALGCAAEIQRLLERSGLGEELPVRMGLHAGEPLQNGQDVIGHAVNVAERIMDQAEGGEILLSQLVKELAGSLEGFQFVDRGERRLKGVKHPLRLYAFEPVRALAHPLDSEIDRELEELERRLREEDR